MKSPDGYHECPRNDCKAQVPDRMFSCRDHWFELSRETRYKIQKTARLSILASERRVAFRMAYADWGQ